MKQQDLPGIKSKGKRVHGGGYAINGRRKEARPLSTKRPMHIVMRSERAKGIWGLRTGKNFRYVSTIVTGQARKHGIKLVRWENVGNHLHFMAKSNSREGMTNFLISVPALIARKITGARKGNPVGKFWDGLVFSRVLTTYSEEKTLFNYIGRNGMEAILGRWAREYFETRAKEPVWDPDLGWAPPDGRWVSL